MAVLEALYRREHRDLVRLAHLVVGDGARAEELVHDAFLRLAPHVGRTENPGGYLRTTVVNLCRDDQRRAAVARRHVPERPLAVAPPPVPAESTAVWQALRDLPARQRTALALRYYADLPTDEIARLLDARPATVRSLLHRGLATLKEAVPRD
jgi:RNA polymerase sigma factor (sigma-70 family)